MQPPPDPSEFEGGEVFISSETNADARGICSGLSPLALGADSPLADAPRQPWCCWLPGVTGGEGRLLGRLQPSGLERRVLGFATSDSSRLLSEIFLAGAESESFLFGKAKQ